MFEFNLNEHDYNRVHFIGIGGISMSGLAHLLLEKGYEVTGSDRSLSDSVKGLIKLGIEVYIGQKKKISKTLI